ncbi:MAG: hypothetical protein FWE96_00370 [Coriobacteriia bacterium]|nr:hypothetical protein [Coriobacteriia bacterium]
MFQFDQGQIGTLTPSPCSNPVPLFQPCSSISNICYNSNSIYSALCLELRCHQRVSRPAADSVSIGAHEKGWWTHAHQ